MSKVVYLDKNILLDVLSTIKLKFTIAGYVL